MTTSILTIALAVVALVLVWLGYQLAVGRLQDAHSDIARQQAALDAQWWQLDQTRRIRSVFYAARQAMRAEAENDLWPPVTEDTNPNRNDDQEKTR